MSSALRIHDLEIAMEMGFRDFHDKKARTENPYVLRTLRVAWEEGWEEGELEARAKSKPFLRLLKNA